MSADVAALRVVVHGRVQGVGFRFFVQRQADALGLSGWVRNLENGTGVQLRAEGPPEALERLLEDLRRGPRMAFVERVDATWNDPEGLTGFVIRY